jgi:hypothetical protein
MPHVLKRWRTLLEGGEKSATKWKRDEEKTALSALRVTAKDLIAKTSTEQSANLQTREFQNVVDTFKTLLEHLRCPNAACMSYLYTSPRNGKPEELRCNCGRTAINLKT